MTDDVRVSAGTNDGATFHSKGIGSVQWVVYIPGYGTTSALSAGTETSLDNPLPVGNGQISTISGSSARIASAASISSSIDLGTGRLVAILYPGTWTAAALTFQASTDNSTFGDIYDAATERNYTVTAGKYVVLSPIDWISVRYLKLRSGTAASAVTQGGNRDFTLVLMK